MAEALKALIRRRGYVRASVTKLCNSLKEFVSEDKVDIGFYLEKLFDHKKNLISLDDSIHSIILDEAYKGEFVYEADADKCQEYLDSLSGQISKLNSAHVDFNQGQSRETNFSKLNLPKVELPTFSGRPEEYRRFFDSFEGIISKFNLSQFEKYSYLFQQLSGPAKDLVASVPHSGYCYDVAMQLLADAFSSKIIQQFSVIERLLKLKLTNDSDIHHWISEVRILVDQVKGLNIDGDIFLQYFVWSSLSGRYKEAFVSATNEARPDISDILEYAFVVASRVSEFSANHKLVEHKFSMATSVSAETNSALKKNKIAETVGDARKGCQLCKSLGGSDGNDHRIFNCNKFHTAISKINRIKELNGCTKCGLLNHTIGLCKFKFSKKCHICFAWHSSFLCTKDVGSTTNKNAANALDKSIKTNKGKGSSKETMQGDTMTIKYDVMSTQTRTIKYDVMSTQTSSKSIVPTFTIPLNKVGKSKGSKLNIRTLYDPASQVTFILADLIPKINHRVVKENVNIQITGFNEQRWHTTKIVECTLMVRNDLRAFQAVVVPEIKSTIPIPSLQKIRSSFTAKSIPLADKQLTKENDGRVGILLGVDYAHVLPVQSCTFGGDQKSLIYHTGLGVMLAGDSDRLEKNLPYLDAVKSFVDCIRKGK